MTHYVQRIPQNREGRDFVVGDIHAEFSVVDHALELVKFDPTRDRLFSVGDLIDRGPEPERVVEFLAQPYVHAVLGNHEDMLLKKQTTGDAIYRPTTWGNGSEWWRQTSPEIRQQVRAAVKKLPLAIETETERGKVGFIHGDVPGGMDWPTFCAELEQGNGDVIETALWGRDRIELADDSGVRGLGRLFVGHSPQFDGAPVRLGNVYFVDTGAFYRMHGGHLTLMNIQLSTQDAVREIEIDERVGAREGPVPGEPYGQYTL